MRYSKPSSREQDLKVVVPSFEWLRAGDRVGLKKTVDNRVLVYYNCELLDTAFERVPDVSDDRKKNNKFDKSTNQTMYG